MEARNLFREPGRGQFLVVVRVVLKGYERLLEVDVVTLARVAAVTPQTG